MALNFQQVMNKIKEIGRNTPGREQSLKGWRERAVDLFHTWAEKTAELRDRVERARQYDPGLRCALPQDERLDAQHPEPQLTLVGTLLAADGSQILPDRHDVHLYSLVNVGTIALQPGSGKSPEILTDSLLLYADELYTETGMLSAEAIEQRRDIAERRKILELASLYPAPLLAFTDGPVELWGAKGGGEEDYRRNLETHKSVLSQLQERDVTLAGYVDKPGADLLIRSLEIALLSSEEELKGLRSFHPLRGVTDRWLFRFLPCGSRSAVFGLQSASRVHYTGSLALHFFYLNVGVDDRHPYLVRVEFPRWVADQGDKLDWLHSALLQQCRVMGAKPYPYLLHRAHEVAVVKFEEKKQVAALLDMEIRRNGGEPGESSNKSSAKGLPGRGSK